MTDEQLSEIEARANAATPGPWGIQKSTDDVNDRFLMAAVISSDDVVGGGMYLRDATFIASAREDVPALVAEVRRLHAERETLADLECRLMEGYAEARTLFEAIKAHHHFGGEVVRSQTTAGVVSQISSMVAGLIAENERLRAERALDDDSVDKVEDLIRRLLHAEIEGELYGVDEQIPQMRRMLRMAFAPLTTEIVNLRADVERIGAERDDMSRANAELQARLSAMEDDHR